MGPPRAIQIIVVTIACSLVISSARAGDALQLPGPQCEPVIRGVLWWLKPETDRRHLNRILDAMGHVGMDILWLLGTVPLADDPDDTLLERIFTQADRRGWRVIIETSCAHQWWVKWDVPALKEADRKHVETVTRRYGHHRSFYGWYINYEVYMEWGENSRKIRELYNHIGRLTRKAVPEAKLTISPFYLADKDQIRGSFRYATPREYGDWWTETIRQAGIRIVMLQDSGAVHCECVPPQTRAAFFAAMQRACRANHAELWGNVETVEHRARDWQEYARRGKQHRQAKTEYPWSFDMERNAKKLDLASRFCSHIVSWGWEFWNPIVPQAEVGDSVANYNAYARYYRGVSARKAATTTSRPRGGKGR